MPMPKSAPGSNRKLNSFVLSTSSDFYFRTLLRYVRSSSAESFKEKVPSRQKLRQKRVNLARIGACEGFL